MPVSGSALSLGGTFLGRPPGEDLRGAPGCTPPSPHRERHGSGLFIPRRPHGTANRVFCPCLSLVTDGAEYRLPQPAPPQKLK